MAQLWGGRFTKQTDQLVYDFNASIGFDQKLLGEDITGSIAHVTMLAKQGIVTQAERDSIIEGLKSILKDVEEGKLAVTSQYEDVHSFVEAKLTERIGEAGKKLHTGRSRNDQVALDMRMYVRSQVKQTDALLKALLCVLYEKMEENLDTYM
ncbi:MAG: argininosuccinate lyase, partial [Lachnospiraceae bacterium]|nr:argininosuccinate lyase [Lachnospiraceae bacterium]